MDQYNLVVSGGTFDLFHIGHEEFLKFQLKISKKILLGITSDNYLRSFPKPHDAQSYEDRKKAVVEFLKKVNALGRVDILSIDTPDPSNLKERKVDALVVTPETKRGADLINKKRANSGLPKLKVIKFNIVLSEDGLPISSTRIRQGEIARSGKVFVSASWPDRTLYLPTKMRKYLKEPFGKLIKNNDYDFAKIKSDKTVSVGDISTKTLLDKNIIPKIAVVDLVVEREKRFTGITALGFHNTTDHVKIENKAGTITPALWREIKKNLITNSSSVIQVIGEEDLAVLPVILLAPLGWKVFYGQPGKGLVVISIDSKIKERAHNLLKSFTQLIIR